MLVRLKPAENGVVEVGFQVLRESQDRKFHYFCSVYGFTSTGIFASTPKFLPPVRPAGS